MEFNERDLIGDLTFERNWQNTIFGKSRWGVAYWTPDKYKIKLFRTLNGAKKWDETRYYQDHKSAFFRFYKGEWYRYKEEK